MKCAALIFVFYLSFAPAIETARAADNVIKKSVWMEQMKTVIPDSFCRGKGFLRYFRECFTVTEDQCVEEMVRDTKVCLLSIVDQIPDELNQPEDGRNWGSKLGRCVGTRYDLAFRDRLIKSAGCPEGK
jgi:hypothetical protein